MPGTPDLSLFPRSAWAAARSGRADGAAARGASATRIRAGCPRLRTALAELLAQRRGVVTDPERTMVVSGVARATALLT